jgi:hypothetical protein
MLGPYLTSRLCYFLKRDSNFMMFFFPYSTGSNYNLSMKNASILSYGSVASLAPIWFTAISPRRNTNSWKNKAGSSLTVFFLPPAEPASYMPSPVFLPFSKVKMSDRLASAAVSSLKVLYNHLCSKK